MKVIPKIIAIVLGLIIGFSSTTLTVSATDSSITTENTLETSIDEIKNSVIEEGLSEVEKILDSTLEKLNELDVEIPEEKKIEIVKFILDKSGAEYDINEVEQQIKNTKQTISDISEALKIVGDILGKIIDTFKQVIESITNWFNDFKQTEDYDIIVNDLNNLADTIESKAAELESKSGATD